jgi:hypothetical protein
VTAGCLLRSPCRQFTPQCEIFRFELSDSANQLYKSIARLSLTKFSALNLIVEPPVRHGSLNFRHAARCLIWIHDRSSTVEKEVTEHSEHHVSVDIVVGRQGHAMNFSAGDFQPSGNFPLSNMRSEVDQAGGALL